MAVENSRFSKTSYVSLFLIRKRKLTWFKKKADDFIYDHISTTVQNAYKGIRYLNTKSGDWENYLRINLTLLLGGKVNISYVNFGQRSHRIHHMFNKLTSAFAVSAMNHPLSI